MTDRELIQNYLFEHIPLTRALGLTLNTVSDDKVIVSAPFANNINHKKTVFGGSLHAVLILAYKSVYKLIKLTT